MLVTYVNTETSSAVLCTKMCLQTRHVFHVNVVHICFLHFVSYLSQYLMSLKGNKKKKVNSLRKYKDT